MNFSKTTIIYWFTEKGLITNRGTLEIVDSLREKYNINYELTTMRDNYSCWRVLEKYWGKGKDIILIDQDMLFSEEQLKALIETPEPNAFYYYDGAKYTQFNLRNELPNITIWNDVHGLYNKKELEEEKLKYAEKCSFGFAKIGKDFQKVPFGSFDVNGPIKSGIGIDVAILENTGVRKWYIMGEVVHDHNMNYFWYVNSK